MGAGAASGDSKPEEASTIRAWTLGDTLLEFYRYTPGPAEAAPKHSHEEYQFGLSLDSPGEYQCRWDKHPVPVGSLSVVQSGEPHRTRSADFSRTATYRMLYVKPDPMRRVAAEVAGRRHAEPSFPNIAVRDGALVRAFLGFCRALETSASGLVQDTLLLSTLALFVERHADTRPGSETAFRERRAVRVAREYLEDNPAENVRLEELARVANLSPYYLNRVFSREVGMPPHRYQLQVRLDRAKALLIGGAQIKQVVDETGFADHSHLTRHFKRQFQVPPSRYLVQNRKNVQDTDR